MGIIDQHAFLLKLLIITSISFQQCITSIVFSPDNFTDIPVHVGYSIKYWFKDNNYLDIEIIPNRNLDGWLALTLTKGAWGSNQLSVQRYNGKDFEQIDSPNSTADVGTCKEIRKHIYQDLIFATAVKCDRGVTKMDIFLIDSDDFIITSIQQIDHIAVMEAQFWENVRTNELNLIVVAAPKSSRYRITTANLFHYVLNEKLELIPITKLYSPNTMSVSVFNIGQDTFVAISIYRNVAGKYEKSAIYIQDFNGTLSKHQDIRMDGTISLTYFCFHGDEKSDHFLIAASNKHMKGTPIKKTLLKQDYEESIVFKWDDGYFKPFQSLLVKFPSPWIPVTVSKDKLVILTWSYVEGLVSYQYDGWRFKRTALDQPDNASIISRPNLAKLKRTSIGGEIVFTIFSNWNRAKKMYFMVPLFKDKSKYRQAINNNYEWCNGAYRELSWAWNEFKPDNDYLTSRSLLKDDNPTDKIMSLFDIILHRKLQGVNYNDLEIMSQHASSSDLENDLEFEQQGRESTYEFAHNMVNVSHAHPVQLCDKTGIYVEGRLNDQLFGSIYEMNDYGQYQYYQSLKINSSSIVEGVCMKELTNPNCFIVKPKADAVCSLSCGQAMEYFQCDVID